jgi:hypothetical protein
MESGLQREKVAAYGRMATFTELSVNVFLRNGIQLNDLLMVVWAERQCRHSTLTFHWEIELYLL